jgi:hypothetical protein
VPQDSPAGRSLCRAVFLDNPLKVRALLMLEVVDVSCHEWSVTLREESRSHIVQVPSHDSQDGEMPGTWKVDN